MKSELEKLADNARYSDTYRHLQQIEKLKEEADITEYLKGEKTSTNPIATIFAWSGALRKRGELDNIPALCDYADKLEKASIQTMEDGVMDKNLAAMSKLESKRPVDTETFLTEINSRLAKLMG